MGRKKIISATNPEVNKIDDSCKSYDLSKTDPFHINMQKIKSYYIYKMQLI